MTALKTPAPDAPAEEWGAFAESIPGWRNPSPTAVLDSLAMPRIEVGSPIGDLPSPRFVVDPDHWAWWGWLLRLLGPGAWDDVAPGSAHAADEEGWWAWIDGQWSEGMTLGRACIAVAAAYGQWPGGEG